MTRSSFKAILDHNIRTFRRQPLLEISGSVGDLGVFLPILIALSQNGSISLATTLIFTGVYNIATGMYFGIPLPVQPMKAIAAVAILRGFSAGELAAAGIFVAVCILVFSVTGLLEWFTKAIPIPVIKGIQVGAGLSLMIAAGSSALSKLSWIRPSWADNYIWLVAAFAALFVLNIRGRIPYAFILTVLGVVFALIRVGMNHSHFPSLHVWIPWITVPRGNDWIVGVVDAGLGQLPLTTLNSIVAVTYLAADLLPDITSLSVTSIGLSVAAMNLIGCWFGCMPVCHGSGGLAAQYRFGARSGASIIFLGLLKLILGLLFGESLSHLLDKFPTAFLSVMVIAAGLELASVGESLNTTHARDLKHLLSNGVGEEQRKQRWMVFMVTAGTLVAFKNDAIGFLAGMFCHYSFRLAARFDKQLGQHGEREPLLS